MKKIKYIIVQFNNSIIKKPIITYIFTNVFLLILIIITGTIGGIIWWLATPYFCYILAKSRNRNKILWAILGLIFPPAFFLLDLLPVSKDGVW